MRVDLLAAVAGEANDDGSGSGDSFWILGLGFRFLDFFATFHTVGRLKRPRVKIGFFTCGCSIHMQKSDFRRHLSVCEPLNRMRISILTTWKKWFCSSGRHTEAGQV